MALTGLIYNTSKENDREQWRRSLAEAGLTLVDGSFEEGATANNKTDAVWYIAGGQCYSWGGVFPKVVPIGSIPASTGGVGSVAWVSVGDASLRTDLITEGGSYLIDDSRIKTIQSITGAVARSQHEKNSDVISVKDYGAVGDGVADDTAAIQAAINAMSPVNARVFIPAGKYNISSALTVPNTKQRWRIYGEGYASRIITTTDVSIFNFQTTNNGFLTYGEIDSLCLDGNNVIGTSALIDTAYSVATNFHNLNIIDFHSGGHGIHVRGAGTTYSHDTIITDIYFNSAQGESFITFDSTAADGMVSRIYAEGRFGVGYGFKFLPGAAQWIISDIHIYNTTNNVVAVESNSGAICFNNCVIDNSQFGSGVVYLKNANGIVFTNGKIMFARNSNNLLVLENSFNCKVIGTSFEASGGSELTGSAIVEISNSNDNSFLGIVTSGNFVANPPYQIIGQDSVLAPLGCSDNVNISHHDQITASGTLQLSPFGGVNSTIAGYVIQRPGFLRSVDIQTSNTPGASQQYTCEVKVNNITVASASITDGSFSMRAVPNPSSSNIYAVKNGDVITIFVYGSGGAASSYARGTMKIDY